MPTDRAKPDFVDALRHSYAGLAQFGWTAEGLARLDGSQADLPPLVAEVA